MGFSPVHKDLALEGDAMTFHIPPPNTDDNLVRAFADTVSNAACNPDGTKGINLHFSMKDADVIPHQDSITVYEIVNGTWQETWSDFDKLEDDWFGNASERSSNNSDNILDAKRKIFHYVIFGHTFNNQPYSGLSRGIGGMDFLFTLGGENWPEARIGPNEYHSVGTPSIIEGTLMHELGHNLGLGHGGGDYVNNKPRLR
jgi:hypothetical protein